MYPSLYLYLALNLWVVFLDVIEKEGMVISSNLNRPKKYIKPVGILASEKTSGGGHYCVFMHNLLIE